MMKPPATRANPGMWTYRTSYDNAVARAVRLAVARERRRIRKAIMVERAIVFGRWDALAAAECDSARKRSKREAQSRICQGLDLALACVRPGRKP